MVKTLPALLILSQVSPVLPVGGPTDWYAPLVNAGAMGVVLLFFMWQFSKKEDERNTALRDVAKAMNSNTQGMMVVVLALKNVDEGIKDMANRIANDTKPTS